MTIAEWCDSLTTVGLENGVMSKNAKAYYEFYLDGITDPALIELQKKK